MSNQKNKDEERSHPLNNLLKNTTPQQHITDAPPPAPNPPPVTPPRETVPPPQQPPEVQRPKPPETRIRTGLKYDQRYAKESIVVDRRLVSYYFQLIETYPNKTVMATEMIVRACKERGIELPSDWDKQPFPD